MSTANKAAGNDLPDLLSLGDVGRVDELSPLTPLKGFRFHVVAEGLQDLLKAAVALQEYGAAGEEENLMATSMGKYIQHLRNQLAEDMGPIFNAFGMNGPDY